MMSQPGKQAIVIHILPNISRSLANKTMKFDKLMEYNLKKSLKNHIRSKSKKSKLDISLDH